MVQRARLQPMLDDFPFQALSRQFAPDAWLRPFEPSPVDLCQDTVSQGESFPKRRRIQGKQSVSPEQYLAVQVVQGADEVLSTSDAGDADEVSEVEEFFTEGALEAMRQDDMGCFSSPSIGVEAGSPIDEGFEGGGRAHYYHPHMCDRFRGGGVPCPWDAVFEFCPCVPRGHHLRHLRWSSAYHPYLLPQWVVWNKDPIPLPDQV